MNLQPNRFFHLSLIFLVALNLLPHISDYTLPTLAVGGLCVSWRLLYEYQYVPLPNFFTKLGLIIGLSYLVYLNYGQLFGQEAGSALLICAVSLKLIDRVGYRDAMVLLFLNFMLLLTRFFESQSLGITIFAVFDLVITTALLVQLHNGSSFKFDGVTLLKTGTKLVLQISPLMILLFFVFPRFSTNFLKAQGAGRASSGGFSSSLEPGAVAQIAQENQMAFRVRFQGEVPPITERYWRGAVLAVNRGMKWDRGPLNAQSLAPPDHKYSESIKQEVMIEPLFNSWIFALDRPVWIEHRNSKLSGQTIEVSGSTYMLRRPYDKKYVYDAYSMTHPPQQLSRENRDQYLQADTENDPRVLKLVEAVQKDAKNNEHKALRLMQFYQKQFRYTLNPGRLNTNTLGEFLFEKKQGFCEHFAVSFASLMRLAGVPSRVVMGFHGGRKNDLSDYFMVTTKDAHAWTEIWSDEKKQWLRFDPTLMVSPLRFELGGDLFHAMSEDQLSQYQTSPEFLSEFNGGWLNKTVLAYDALATSWNLFLLNYDQTGQQSFFARFGFKNLNQGRLLTISLLILLCYFLWVRISSKNKKQKEEPAQRAYLLLRKKLGKQGIEKESFEGPSDFLLRCQEELPQYSEVLEEFRQLYLLQVYGLNQQPIDFSSYVRRLG